MSKKWSEIDSISDAADTFEFIVISGGFSRRISKQNYLKELVAKNVEQDALISSNASKVSYTDASLVAQHTVDIQSINNGTTPKEKTTYTDVTSSEPSYVEGQAYYANGTFNIHGEYDGVTLQLGQEQYIKVANISGVDIPNGVPVYVLGISGGLPAIELAQADTFEKSRVIGITTMIIPNNSDGLVTTIGSVGDLNTDGLTAGSPLYLSASAPGGVTEVPPDIATSLGSVLIVDSTAGKMFVKVNNHIVLPTIFGEMDGGSTGGNITNIYQPINDYASHSNLAMLTDEVTGTIHIPTSGKYRMTANISINYDNIGNSKPALTLGIHDGTSVVAEVVVTVTKDSEGFALFPSKLFDAVGGTDLGLEIKCDTDLINPIFDLMSFEIESTHIR